MNQVDRPSPWRTKVLTPQESAGFTTIGGEGSETNTPVQVREVGAKPEATPDATPAPEAVPAPPATNELDVKDGE